MMSQHNASKQIPVKLITYLPLGILVASLGACQPAPSDSEQTTLSTDTADAQSSTPPAQTPQPVDQSPEVVSQDDVDTSQQDPTAVVEAAPSDADIDSANTDKQPEMIASDTQAHTEINGEAIYNQACKNCHSTGVLESPRLSDAAAWQPRIAQGIETLYQHSIHGYGKMPAKGGYLNLSDAEVKAGVDYMVAKIS